MIQLNMPSIKRDTVNHQTVITARVLALMLIGVSVLFSHFAVADDGVLVIRPANEHFEQVLHGMESELEGEVGVYDVIVDKKTEVASLYKEVQERQPSAMVLMGNHSLSLYTKLQEKYRAENIPPAVAVAAVFADWVMASKPGKDRVTGILYEIPAVTGLVTLRSISQKEIKRVGMLYRKGMEGMVENNTRFCKLEGIELIPMEVKEADIKKPKRFKKLLKKLSKNSLDALWITNDSVLLRPELVVKAWVPFLSKFDKSVLVGVETLIGSNLNIGNLGVFPDHNDLGTQTASILFELLDQEWDFSERSNQYDQPISVKKHLNLKISKQRKIGLHESRFSQLDEVLEQ